jgi:hypothetical protein
MLSKFSLGMAELFRFPSALRHDPAVDAWLDAQTPVLGSMARTWLAQMRRCGPDVRELMHDGCPVACVGDAAFAYVNVFTAHVNVGFYLGAHLDDPAGLLQGSGKRMRHVKLLADVEPDGTALGRLIEDAYTDMSRRLQPLHADTR